MRLSGNEPDLGVGVQHTPHAQIHLELGFLRITDVHGRRTIDDGPLTDATQERSETVGVRRVVEE